MATLSISIHIVNCKKIAEEDRARVQSRESILRQIRDQLKVEGKGVNWEEVDRLKRLLSWTDVFYGRKLPKDDDELSEWEKKDLEKRTWSISYKLTREGSHGSALLKSKPLSMKRRTSHSTSPSPILDSLSLRSRLYHPHSSNGMEMSPVKSEVSCSIAVDALFSHYAAGQEEKGQPTHQLLSSFSPSSQKAARAAMSCPRCSQFMVACHKLRTSMRPFPVEGFLNHLCRALTARLAPSLISPTSTCWLSGSTLPPIAARPPLGTWNTVNVHYSIKGTSCCR
ncbi:hypothetical protein NMY22_g8434 [Coprinellus aureogranulatus]|nr:hypothetical protein NMY22_g8434 [Coprinellus aureogranulatus]